MTATSHTNLEARLASTPAKTLLDAPAWYGPTEATAYAHGYNQAIRDVRLTIAHIDSEVVTDEEQTHG